MGLHQLAQAGHDVGRAVQHRLVCDQRQVGEDHVPGVAGVVSERLGQRHRQQRRADAASTGDGHEPSAPALPRGDDGARVGEYVGEGRGVALQGVEEGTAVEGGAEHGVDAQHGPVPLRPGGVDGEGGTAGGVGGVDEVAVEPVGAGVDQQRRVGAGRGQAGPDLLGADAAYEVGGDGARRRPPAQLREPGGAWVGQAEQGVADRRHHELRRAVEALAAAVGSAGRW